MDEVKDEDKDCKDKVEKENKNKRKDKNEAWVEYRNEIQTISNSVITINLDGQLTHQAFV